MPQPDIHIAPATRTDLPLLAQLSEQTFRETFAPYNNAEDMDKYIACEMNSAKLAAELEDERNLFFLAAYQGAPVGYAKITAQEMPSGLNSHNPLELARIYVLQEYQRQKAGSALLRHCLTYAVSMRHDVLWLGVWEHNEPAIRFYEQWGFEFFGSHIFRLGNDDQTDLLMKKVL